MHSITYLDTTKCPSELILFVSGPMQKYANTRYNYSSFEDAATRLRNCGYNVLSPHEHYDGHEPGDKSEIYYTRDAFSKLLQCDGVALIDDYWNSDGVAQEITLARWCSIAVAPIEYWFSYAAEHSIKEKYHCPQETSGPST